MLVEAFLADTGRGGKIPVELELPVGPANKELVGDICDLRDFLSARTLGQTSAKFGDHKRHTIPLSVSRACSDSLPVPYFALMLQIDVRFAGCADFRIKLAAVSMVVENVIDRAELSTGRIRKARFKDNAWNFAVAEEWETNHVWESVWLEPHDRVFRVCIVLFK